MKVAAISVLRLRPRACLLVQLIMMLLGLMAFRVSRINFSRYLSGPFDDSRKGPAKRLVQGFDDLRRVVEVASAEIASNVFLNSCTSPFSLYLITTNDKP